MSFLANLLAKMLVPFFAMADDTVWGVGEGGIAGNLSPGRAVLTAGSVVLEGLAAVSVS